MGCRRLHTCTSRIFEDFDWAPLIFIQDVQRKTYYLLICKYIFLKNQKSVKKVLRRIEFCVGPSWPNFRKLRSFSINGRILLAFRVMCIVQYSCTIQMDCLTLYLLNFLISNYTVRSCIFRVSLLLMMTHFLLLLLYCRPAICALINYWNRSTCAKRNFVHLINYWNRRWVRRNRPQVRKSSAQK